MVLHPFHCRGYVQFPWDFEYKCTICQRTQIQYPTLSFCTFILGISFFPCTYIFQNGTFIHSWKIMTYKERIDTIPSLWACIFISFLFQSVHSSPKPEQQQCKPQCFILYKECQVIFPMNMIWSDSLNCRKLHFPLPIHPPLVPRQKALACVLLMHLPKSKISILDETETLGLIQHQRKGCKLTEPCALLQQLWCVGWRVSPATARSSVLSAQTCSRLAPKCSSRTAPRGTTGQELCWGWGCWTGTTKPCSSQINLLHILTEDSICTLNPRVCFSHCKCTSVWMEQSGQWPLKLPFGGGGTGAKLCSQQSALNIHAFLVHSHKADEH